MTDNGRFDLSTKQRKALASLLGGNENEVAAAAAGVSASTLYRWKQQDNFQAAMRAAQGELIADHTTALSGLLKGNRDVLLSIRDDAEQPGHVRLRAIEIIETTLRNWRDVADFEERLTALEAALSERGEK